MTRDDDDIWGALKAMAKANREARRAMMPQAIEQARAAGLALHFFSPEHVRVDGRFDWWPSTGRWRKINGTPRGFGVSGLIAAVKGSR